MLNFEYEARDEATGQKIKANIQAESESAASKLLVKQGLSPLDIRLKDDNSGLLGSLRNHIGSKDKVLFSRQLSTLINAGLPLTQSLRTVSDQTQNKAFKVIVNQIIADVEGGRSFADALSAHPDVFNTVFISLIAAGEVSGTLDSALERIADQQEKDAELISKIRGALIYPAIVLFVIIAVIVFMLVTVLPQVQLLYDDLHQTLPFITAAMLAMSNFIINFWWLILILLATAVFFGKRYAETTSGRSALDSFKMNVPVFGKLFMKMYMARFSRTGSTLMAAGVPMLEMLRITANAVNNVHIKDATLKAAEKVKGGTALSEAMKGDPNFLPLVSQMISIGEQSGTIDSMMAKAADFFEKELDNEVKTISTTIEPILMVVLALVAGLMVGAILIPVYGLVGQNLAL